MLCRVVRITQVKEQIFVLSVFKVHYFLSGQYVEELTIQTDESLNSVQRGRREGESSLSLKHPDLRHDMPSHLPVLLVTQASQGVNTRRLASSGVTRESGCHRLLVF